MSNKETKSIAAEIWYKSVKLFEKLEDMSDILAAEAAMQEIDEKGTISLKNLLKELELLD